MNDVNPTSEKKPDHENQDLHKEYHPGTGYTHVESTDPNETDETTPFRKEPEGEDFTKRYDTQKLRLGIQRHLVAIAISIITWFLLGALATWYIKTHYRAEAVVLYHEDLEKTLPGGITMNNLTLATAIDLITIPAHFQAVKAQLGLDLSVKELENMVDVPIPRNQSHFLRIIAKSSSPNLAMDIANSLAKIAVKDSVDFNQKQLQAQLDNFKNQLNNLNVELAKELKALEDFKTAHSYFEMTADYTTLLTRLSEARTKLQAANLRYTSLLVEYENLKRDIANLPNQIEGRRLLMSGGSTNDPVSMRMLQLESAIAEAKSKYTPTNPKLKALQDELDTLKGKKGGEKGEGEPNLENNPVKERLDIELMRLQGRVRSAQKVKQELALSLAKLEKMMENLPSEQITFSKLLQAKDQTEEQIQFLTRSLENIQLMQNVPKGGLELYQLADRARPLNEGFWVPLLPLLGLLVGLVFGLAWAMIIEMRDKRLWTVKQISMAYTIPTLVVVPELSRLKKNNSETRLLFFIRTLAERLERMTPNIGKHCQVVTFTSSKVGEGKSCLAYHLALYYTKVGKKVILIEFDHHANSYSDDTPSTPLATYLKSNTPLNEMIIPGKPDRIKVGVEDPYMKELIKSKQMSALLDALKKDYELVVIDAPGVIEEDYTINLATIADLCVLVVGSPYTSKKLLDQSISELHHFGIIPSGIILNRVAPVYIEDEKIKLETNRDTRTFREKLLFWR